MQQPKKIPALGRTAALGSMYSAYTDKFYPAVNLFAEITEDHYDEIELSSTDIKYTSSNSLTEKIKHFDIGGEVSLSLLAGMIELSGSASYLNTEKENSNCSEMALLYSTVTVNQNIFSIKRMKIDEDVLRGIDGVTHVVAGIDWGARCNISCRYENRTKKSKQDVNGMLGGLVKKLTYEIKAKGKAEWKESDHTDTSDFTFNVKSDVLKMNRIPKSFEEAVEVAVSLPDHVKEINDGKGIPLDFYLLPLGVVAKVCKKDIGRILIVKEIENDTIHRFCQIAREMEQVKLEIATLSNIIAQNENWFPEKYSQIASDCSNKFEILKGKFQSSFQKALEDVRKGESQSSELHEVLKEARDADSGLPSIQYHDIRAEVKYTANILHKLSQLDVPIFGKEQLMLESEEKSIILYLPEKMEQSQKLTDNINFFVRTVKDNAEEKKTGTKYAVQLTSFLPVSFKCPVIKKLKDGQCVVKDVLKEERLNLCIVHVEKTKIMSKQNKDVIDETYELKISCPLSYTDECPRKKVLWIHDECNKIIFYQVNTKRLRCDCGTFDLKDATFRCSDLNHGFKFCNVNDQSLEEISKLKKKTTNILILGESGVGKSTWINAISKYLLYETLEEAMTSNDKTALIPSHFSYTNGEGKTADVTVGDVSNAGNEDTSDGASATQKPTSYLFDIDDGNQVKLIDTPGIGDTRGIKKDNENFEMILHHISYFTEINGICILLQPNSARLSVMLKFCIGELLTHLHKSAADNIMFCFTNCRGTFYQPGQSLPVLQKLLQNYKESNVKITQSNRFMFDNESFRLLACLQNGIEFSHEDIDAYSGSWKKASSETNKLFNYVSNLKPHKTEDTLSLNDTRKWIVQLSEPIAKIQEYIKYRIMEVEEQKKKLEDIPKKKDGAVDWDKLEGLIKVKVFVPYVVKLEEPSTVCRDLECTILTKLNGESRREPIKECHKNCRIDTVTPGQYGDPELLKCRCFFDKPECNECTHKWDQHQHIKHRIEMEVREEIDPETKRMILEKKDKNKTVNKAINDLNKRIMEENEEMKIILEISATFACFLTKHSIAYYNDGVEGHLDYYIDEKTKLGDHQKVEELKQMKKEYITQKEIILKAIKQSAGSDNKYDIDLEGAARLKEELFQLKHNGKTFSDMSKEIAKVESDYNYREVRYAGEKPSKNRKEFNQNEKLHAEPKEKKENIVKTVWNYVSGNKSHQEPVGNTANNEHSFTEHQER